MIDAAVFLVKKQCKQQQRVRLVRDTSEKLPQLLLDPEKIRQVFLNILLNALNVMPDGGEIHIRAGLRQRLPEFSGGPCIEVRSSPGVPGVPGIIGKILQ